MSKCAPQFERRPRDMYPTPPEAVAPLLAHLSPRTMFLEPCAGEGDLIQHLEAAGHVCMGAYDIEPKRGKTRHLTVPKDARSYNYSWREGCFITNPPWARDVLHPIILNLSCQMPTWLLFDADWMHTRQAAPYMGRCKKIISIGRVKWIPDSKFTGKDNACWYLFDYNAPSAAQFIARAA